MLRKMRVILFAICLVGFAIAASSGTGQMVDFSSPLQSQCGGSGNIVDFSCHIMQSLLVLGPILAIMALVVGGIIYVYANVFVTADQRGRYHTLATNLAIGALILAALSGGAGILINFGMKFLTAPTV